MSSDYILQMSSVGNATVPVQTSTNGVDERYPWDRNYQLHLRTNDGREAHQKPCAQQGFVFEGLCWTSHISNQILAGWQQQ